MKFLFIYNKCHILIVDIKFIVEGRRDLLKMSWSESARAVHLNFRAGSTFPVPVYTVHSSMDRTSRCNKVDTVRLYASYRLNLLLLGVEVHECSILEKNFRIHFIPKRHFYGVQFLDRKVLCKFFQPMSRLLEIFFILIVKTTFWRNLRIQV